MTSAATIDVEIAAASGWVAPPALEGEIIRPRAGAHSQRSAYRDAETHGRTEIAMWRPPVASADYAVLRDNTVLRARARDLVRSNPHAKNAVRMVRDAVSGSGLKLALNIDWRSLGIKDIEVAAEWQDFVSRAWESYAETALFNCDARRQQTFSQMFALADITDFVDGESLAVLELIPSPTGVYQTCVNQIDVDRLSNPNGAADTRFIRGGIERDAVGAPLSYFIREGHPRDVGISLDAMTWKQVPKSTGWGRPVVLHTYDMTRPEMSRGVSEFASAIVPMKMLEKYNMLELQTATVQAAYAAVIKTELDWSQAMQVLGAKGAGGIGGSNPFQSIVEGHMAGAASYHNKREITFEGVQIPHLLPNESIDVVKSTHPNANFEKFEAAFIRHLAAGLGVEAHELSKNYAETNYSAARAALLAAWRTYRTRRNRMVQQFAMPVFGAWLEEAIALGTVPLPPGVSDWLSARPYLLRGTFIAWGKPMIDPLKERQGQQIGMQLGVETLEEICAEDGQNWRDNLEKRAYERRFAKSLGLPDPDDMIPGAQVAAPGNAGAE